MILTEVYFTQVEVLTKQVGQWKLSSEKQMFIKNPKSRKTLISIQSLGLAEKEASKSGLVLRTNNKNKCLEQMDPELTD